MQKRNKEGQYGHKVFYWERVFQAFLFAGSVWAVVLIQYNSLPNEVWFIPGSDVRLELVKTNTEQNKTLLDGSTDDGTGGSSLEDEVRQAFPENPSVAVAIMKAESGGKSVVSKPNKNGTRDAGIFQINDVHGYSIEERLDPHECIKLARKVYEKQGWNAWSAYNNKSYLRYL